jgi:hypothetical protein
MSGTKAGPARPGTAIERAWSDRKRKEFLEHLALTANVRASARSVDMSEQSVYRLRGRCDVFRAGWEVALREGYARLELMMLERAIGGTVKPAGKAGQVASEMIEYSDRLGLALLAAHRAAVRGPAEAPADPGAARRRIEAKLEEMNRRLGGGD